MKFIILDLETTGLNPNVHSIIQVGAIAVDTGLWEYEGHQGTFEFTINPGDAVWSPNAIRMHQQSGLLTEALTNGHGPDTFQRAFLSWLESAGYFLYHDEPERITLAGANVGGFDLQFLRRMHWENIYFDDRTIDPAIYCVDYEQDEKLPSLQTCKERTGNTTPVAHTALADCWDVYNILKLHILKLKA